MPISGLVLASASPRRRELLAQIGIVPERIVAPDVDETPQRHEGPRDYVRRVARSKAAAVTGTVVLAADTAVAAGRRILPKAETEAQARACLGILSGRRHRVFTAVVVAEASGVIRERLVDTVVTFARLTHKDIDMYLSGGEWRGKAGGYAIQGEAARFIRFLSGSYSGVVGLPLFETAQLLSALSDRATGPVDPRDEPGATSEISSDRDRA
jgi:septum formation protein